MIQGVELDFIDINYSVKATIEGEEQLDDGEEKVEIKVGSEKQILRGISGSIKGGEMMCVLGPSGSGKTSLLHIIAGRIKTTQSGSHTVEGTVLVDKAPMGDTAFRRMSGMVTQEDIFTGCLTVEETLSFTAALKFRSDPAMREDRVKEVITALQLESCRSTFIGDDANPYMKGISGGEKRRLAIASEILDPNINLLMLDEPTSGLDAAAAQNVANLLRTLADRGMAVIATLHQPRASIMERFNSLMILAKGRTIYSGSLTEYTQYLDSELRCAVPKFESPYELMLDALNPIIAKTCNVTVGILEDTPDRNVSEALADIFQGYSEKRGESTGHKGKSSASMEVVEDAPLGFAAALSKWFFTTWIILHRTFLIKMRDPICLMTQISSAIIMGLIYGALYIDVYNKSTVSFSILDTQMCIVMVVLMCVWLPYDVTLTFPLERRIFLRERKGGMYTTSSFYIARIAADVPAHLLSAFLMAIIVWGMAGLNISLGPFIAIMMYGILIGAATMQLIGAVSRTFEEANIYMMVVLMMSMMLGTGFVREVPSWLGWARDISIMGIVADMAMYLEFKDVDPKYGTAADIFEEYGVLVRNEADLVAASMTLFYILLVCRILCYFAVKFAFTGRTYAEDWAD